MDNEGRGLRKRYKGVRRKALGAEHFGAFWVLQVNSSAVLLCKTDKLGLGKKVLLPCGFSISGASAPLSVVLMPLAISRLGADSEDMICKNSMWKSLRQRDIRDPV